MISEELNIKYIREKTGLVKDDELIPIILEMIKESYKAGLCQAEHDNTMDLIEEKQELIGYLKEEVKKINEMFDGFVPQDYLWQVETKTKLKVYQEILSKIEKR